MEFSLKRLLTLTLVGALCGVSTTSIAASKTELSGVKSEISRQQTSLSSQQKELDKLQKSLKSEELSISNLEKEIKTTKIQLAASETNLKQLKQQQAQLTDLKKAQTEKLEQLIQTYYVTERAKAPSNVLNSGVEEDRMSQYFQHLAKERSKTIAELEETQQQLDATEQQLSAEQQQIENLLESQTAKRDQLARSQSSRKSTVSKIKKSISSDRVYLAELQRNETRLKAEIAKAAKRNAVPMDGLAKQKKKLPWPINGKVLHNYGSRQTGQIKWNGMVIDANYGQPIKAVYSGTVVFAEYLRGYGLVVLLDHGKGDMTLYGFNQSLMKKEGDKVRAGETIALAGDTGGQSQASLYFEIRRNSKTQNPKSWLK